MEANLEVRSHALGSLVDIGISCIFPVIPELFPSEDFRIVDHDSPERNEIAVCRALIRPSLNCKGEQFLVAFDGPINVDPPLFGCLAVKLTKAGDGNIPATCIGSYDVVQRTLLFGAPHHPVNVIRSAMIACQVDHKISIVRVVSATGCSPFAVDVDLFQLFDVWDVSAPDRKSTR